MPFLPPNQQRHSTEGKSTEGMCLLVLYKCCYLRTYLVQYNLHHDQRYR